MQTRITFVTALDVTEGAIIYIEGYRCRASDVLHVDGVARYTLNSAPSKSHPHSLPLGFEGMRSGGNERARVGIEHFAK